MKRLTLPLLAFLLLSSPAAAQEPYLYKATLVQAAPGKLLDLIELYKQKAEADARIGEPATFWMRHSQGDQWDLLLLTPIGSYGDYFNSARITRRLQSARAANWSAKTSEHVALQEDVFVWGPPLEEVRKAFTGNNFFHVEMFQALPGKHAELTRQRQMENTYLKILNRPQNLIFVRELGAAWDAFTIGAYRDLKHYAESADIPDSKEEAAARVAGFASASQIGPYLRTLIRAHHDTLAVSIP